DVDCLGLLPGRVAKLPEAARIRVPHMGWNRLEPLRESSLLEGIVACETCYFVHSYAAPVTVDCVAATQHGTRFAALAQRGNVAGAQFHPERSGSAGAKLLENFVRKGCA